MSQVKVPKEHMLPVKAKQIYKGLALDPYFVTDEDIKAWCPYSTKTKGNG